MHPRTQFIDYCSATYTKILGVPRILGDGKPRQRYVFLPPRMTTDQWQPKGARHEENVGGALGAGCYRLPPSPGLRVCYNKRQSAG
ncbi:hypothetical protein DPEC_G00084380 [Dallia pectoralis]|uniref:Uncharacterized protein n=1 Tax=Dallia pectoralis TaxID=75939 RepID=A0ACC2H036_DALPE|nr:hypothetical protein DPEC_G00084380 [Dallia pectoralis]